MTITDFFEIIAAVALLFAWVSALRWMRLNPTRRHYLLPALSWLVSASLFIFIAIVSAVRTLRVPLNVWGLVLIVHVALLLVMYFRWMGVGVRWGPMIRALLGRHVDGSH